MKERNWELLNETSNYHFQNGNIVTEFPTVLNEIFKAIIPLLSAYLTVLRKKNIQRMTLEFSSECFFFLSVCLVNFLCTQQF